MDVQGLVGANFNERGVCAALGRYARWKLQRLEPVDGFGNARQKLRFARQPVEAYEQREIRGRRMCSERSRLIGSRLSRFQIHRVLQGPTRLWRSLLRDQRSEE